MVILKIIGFGGNQNFSVRLIDTDENNFTKYEEFYLTRKQLNLIHKMKIEPTYAILHGRNKNAYISICALAILKNKFKIENHTHNNFE